MNRDEIERLSGVDFRAGAKRLVKLGCRTVVVTLGKGVIKDQSHRITAYVRDLNMEYEIESKEKDDFPVDTTGAGDAFAAGFLFGWLKDKSPEDCGLLGDIMASFAIRAVGARTGLPTLAQLSRRYLQRSGNPL